MIMSKKENNQPNKKCFKRYKHKYKIPLSVCTRTFVWTTTYKCRKDEYQSEFLCGAEDSNDIDNPYLLAI